MRKIIKKSIAYILSMAMIMGVFATIPEREKVNAEEGEAQESTRYVDANGFTQVPGTATENLGAWKCLVNDWGESGAATISYKGGETVNDFYLRMDKNTADNKPHIVTAETSLPITPGEKYEYKIKFTLSGSDYTTLRWRLRGFTQMTDTPINNGTYEWTGRFKAIGAAKDCTMDFDFGFIKKAGATIHFEEISLTQIETANCSDTLISTKNIAKGKSVTYGDGFTSLNLTDGNLSTRTDFYRATADNSGMGHVVLDLGDSYEVAELEDILLVWNDFETFSDRYTVEISEDGEKYTQICSVTGDLWNLIVGRAEKDNVLKLDFNTDKVQFDTYRYVRLNFNMRVDKIAIKEFAVIQKGELVIETPPVTTTPPTTKPITTTPAATTPTATTTTPIPETTTPTITSESTRATDGNKVKAPGRVKIKKINVKKKTARKVKVSLKKVNSAKGYQIVVYKTKKNAKKNRKAIVKKFSKKIKVTIRSKKLKNRKKLYIRARAYVLKDDGSKQYGAWSKVKKVKIKK